MRWPLLALVVSLSCTAATSSRGTEPAEAQTTPVVTLEIDPALEPVPALRYRLLPPLTDLKPGNAAPIYLRPRHEERDQWLDYLNSEPSRLLEVPRDELKLEEVDDLVFRYRYPLSQLAVGARRETCDWEYPYGEDGQLPEEFLLPDIGQMRSYARLLAIKIRGDVLAARFDEAIASLQTGLALARHVSNAPFLVNRLVGVSIASMMLSEVESLLTQPGAPNLYWALAALPRPLVDVRSGLDYEREFLLYRFPELRQLDRPRSPQEWQRLEEELRRGSQDIYSSLESYGELPRATSTGRQATLDDARLFLAKHLGKSTEQIGAMCDAEVTVRYTHLVYYHLFDLIVKSAYAPRNAEETSLAANDLLAREAHSLELIPFAAFLVPSARPALAAPALATQARLDRQVANLQTVAALSLFASTHDAKLPASLDELAPPAPQNALDRMPLEYKLNADGTAELKVPAPVNMPASLRVDWRIKVRPPASK